MAKQKISITIDEELIELLENMLEDTQFRNRSHIIEHSLTEFLKNKGKLEKDKVENEDSKTNKNLNLDKWREENLD